MLRRNRLIAAILTLLLGVTACGGGGGGSGDGGLQVGGVDFEFRPDSWTVAAGAEVEISFENAGTVEHNWVILAEPIRNEDELAEATVLFKISAAPGETTQGSLMPPPPGTYQVVCDIPGHFSAGMKGELTVTG